MIDTKPPYEFRLFSSPDRDVDASKFKSIILIIYNHTIIYQSKAADYAALFVRFAQCARVQLLSFRTDNTT